MLWGRCRCHAVRISFRDHMDHVVDPGFRGILGEILRVRGTVYLAVITTARSVKEFLSWFDENNLFLFLVTVYSAPLHIIYFHYFLKITINNITSLSYLILGLIAEIKIKKFYEEFYQDFYYEKIERRLNEEYAATRTRRRI